MTKAPITQAAKLEFPQDTVGFTSSFKRETARAIGRIGGKEDKLTIFLDTLDILRQYAIDKCEAQGVAVVAKRDAEIEKAKWVIAADQKRKAIRIAQKKAEIDMLEGEIERLEPKTTPEAVAEATPKPTKKVVKKTDK